MYILSIKSQDFENNTFLDSKFSCEWNNLIPKLEVSNIPHWTKSLAIIIDDPDAPAWTWIHFIWWNINVKWLEKVILFENNRDEFNWMIKWINSYQELNWWWPCPPKWHWVHRYFFKIYTLDVDNLNLLEWANKYELLDSIKNHQIWYGEIIGLYKRD